MSLRTTILFVSFVGLLFAVQPAHGNWNFPWDRPFAFDIQRQETGAVLACLGALGIAGLGYWLYQLWTPKKVCKERVFQLNKGGITVVLRNYYPTNRLMIQKTQLSSHEHEGEYVLPDKKFTIYYCKEPSDKQAEKIYIAPLGIFCSNKSSIFDQSIVMKKNIEVQAQGESALKLSYNECLSLALKDNLENAKGKMPITFVFKQMNDKTEEVVKMEAESLVKALRDVKLSQAFGQSVSSASLFRVLRIEIYTDSALFDIYQEAFKQQAERREPKRIKE